MWLYRRALVLVPRGVRAWPVQLCDSLLAPPFPAGALSACVCARERMTDGCAVLLCLGCPTGITFGIDSKQWTGARRASGLPARAR